jgi:hypothetical protein
MKKQNQNQTSKIESSNKGNDTLFQTFYVFGIEPNDLDISDFKNDSNYLETKFKELKLLTKFPPRKNQSYEIEPNIIMNHCFPKGYKLVESSKDNNLQDEYFFFSLENVNRLNPENKRIYYIAVIIYEPVNLYLNIKYDNKIPSLPKKNSKPLNNIYIPKGFCLSMIKPFPFEAKNLMKELLDYFRGNQITLPMEKIIESIIYGIPKPLRAYFYISCKKTNEFFPKQKQDIDFRMREFNQYNFSSYIYQLIFTFSLNDVLTIFKCLLFEIPILFFGKDKEILTNIVETFFHILHPLEFQYPYVSILPDNYCGLIETEKCFLFGINESLIFDEKTNNQEPTYFKDHLLNVENKLILICDIDNRKLYKNEKLNNTFHVVYFNDFGVYPDKTNMNENIQLESKEINSYKDYEDFEICLPQHITEKLSQEITQYLSQINKKDKNNVEGINKNAKYSEAHNKKIGEDFFYNYIKRLFKNYFEYMYNDEENVKRIITTEIMDKLESNVNIENLFMINQYLHEKKTDLEFYNKFFKTKIFKNFIIRHYLNEERDKYDFLRFDEKLLEKKSKGFFKKKIKTEFSSSKVFEFSHIYQIKSANNFLDSELSFMRSHKSALLKDYYQIMGQYNKLKYTIFPKLLYDSKYFQKEYKPNVDLSTGIIGCMNGYNNINNVMRTEKNPYNFFNIYKNNIVRFFPDINKMDINNEVQNSLNKVWIYMFCLTFHYYDENEKRFRFEELMKFLIRVMDEKRELLSILLLTLYKYGDENMIIKVIETFKNITYIEYCMLCNKFKGEWNKKMEKKKVDTTNINVNIFYYREKIPETEGENPNKDNNISNKVVSKEFSAKLIPKKIYTIKKNVYAKKIAFEMNYKCPYCNTLNITTNIAVNLVNKKKSELMLCQKCQKFLEPKIHVVSGNDKCEFSVFSPIKLLNIAREIAILYGEQIDLDELREKYTSFYWSCILYFYLNGFNFEMLLKKRTNDMVLNNKNKPKNINKFKKLIIARQYK